MLFDSDPNCVTAEKAGGRRGNPGDSPSRPLRPPASSVVQCSSQPCRSRYL